MADQYGCRVVYQPNLDRLLVTPTGQGTPLPFGPCESITAGVDSPRVPVRIGVAGSPVRIQARFVLEAVGEDWDGRYLPINDLSYAPKMPGQVQIATLTYVGAVAPTSQAISVSILPGAMNAYEVGLSLAGTINANLTGFVAFINADPQLSQVMTASLAGQTITLTGNNPGEVFGATLSGIIPLGCSWTFALTQAAAPANQVSWTYCLPPLFQSVSATPNLSITEARDLARKSVYRCYRILMIDPATGLAPLKLPWYQGPILRRQQIILEQTKVQQVVPAPRIAGAGLRNNVANGFLKPLGLAGVLPEFYNGFSRDQAATCTGSIAKACTPQVMWDASPRFNTPAGSRIFSRFSIDVGEQIVVFGDYIYATAAGGVGAVPAAVTLETACTVLDAETNQVVRWEEVRDLGGPAPTEWTHHDDVKVGVLGIYSDASPPDGSGSFAGAGANPALEGAAFNGLRNVLQKWIYADGDLEDVKGRAGYYLDGMQARYQMPQSDGRQYIGIIPIDPDGLIHQVTWSLGPGGASTSASANSEINIVVPNYFSRRRAENLGPNIMQGSATSWKASWRAGWLSSHRLRLPAA